MAVIPSPYLDAVVAIGIKQNGQLIWIGTGFFLVRRVDKNGDGHPFLITNRHVLEGRKSLIKKLKRDDMPDVYNMKSNRFPNCIIVHKSANKH